MNIQIEYKSKELKALNEIIEYLTDEYNNSGNDIRLKRLKKLYKRIKLAYEDELYAHGSCLLPEDLKKAAQEYEEILSADEINHSQFYNILNNED